MLASFFNSFRSKCWLRLVERRLIKFILESAPPSLVLADTLSRRAIYISQSDIQINI